MDNSQSFFTQSNKNRKRLTNSTNKDSQNRDLSKRAQFKHSLSQPKSKNNKIIVNKSKLPPDFFPKTASDNKKLPHFKLLFKEEQREFSLKIKKAQSQRLHYSPQKTSFFGFFQGDNANQQNNDYSNSSKKFPEKRRFQTRQEPKRQTIQHKRKFTPGTYSTKNQLLDLFPATHDNQLTQIIISTSNARNSKLSPRKEHISKIRQVQPLYEQINQMSKSLVGNQELSSRISSPVKNVISLKNIQKSRDKIEKVVQQKEQINLHNMTFFNVKSSTLPPIKRPL